MPKTMARILIVNENESSSRFIKFILENAGFQARILENSLSLFDEIKADPPSLVIMDIFLKYVDGLYLLEKFRSMKSAASIPVLVVASKNEPLALIDAIERGAFNYLSAPVNEDALIMNVNKCLARSQKNNRKS